jgi:hypothetical protein
MSDPRDNNQPPVNDTRRINSPAGWIVGVIFVLAILGTLLFYNGHGGKTASDPNAPNVVTGSNSSGGR